MLASTQRFSSRVDNYLRYRPGYPREVIELLQAERGLNSNSVVADIGAGTGKLTELLLPHAKQVFAMEPNLEMRAAGERLLKSYPQFISVAGTAEATTLPEQSVDLIVAGQAFHWFDGARTRVEFERILKPAGSVALLWNDRRTDATPFLAAYETLLRDFATDYAQVNHRNVDLATLRQFFGAAPALKSFSYTQHFDLAGLKGRLLSSSYAPEPGHPEHDAMLGRLRQIFSSHQQGGQVAFAYDTLVYSAKLT
jgi:ubiquinone/menaquinone biosynthesis C-methylase UbiE